MTVSTFIWQLALLCRSILPTLSKWYSAAQRRLGCRHYQPAHRRFSPWHHPSRSGPSSPLPPQHTQNMSTTASEPAPAPLTLDELVQHPALTNVVVRHEARKKGAAFVAGRRGGPLSLACRCSIWCPNSELHRLHRADALACTDELYGHGPIHLVFIMGLNGPMMAWHRQIKYFGVDRADRFSVLVFDNRGMYAVL